MQKIRLSQASDFFVPAGFAIMTKTNRPFLTPPLDARPTALRCFNQ